MATIFTTISYHSIFGKSFNPLKFHLMYNIDSIHNYVKNSGQKILSRTRSGLPVYSQYLQFSQNINETIGNIIPRLFTSSITILIFSFSWRHSGFLLIFIRIVQIDNLFARLDFYWSILIFHISICYSMKNINLNICDKNVNSSSLLDIMEI